MSASPTFVWNDLPAYARVVVDAATVGVIAPYLDEKGGERWAAYPAGNGGHPAMTAGRLDDILRWCRENFQMVEKRFSRRKGFVTRTPEMDERDRKIVELFKTGLSYRDLGERFGLSYDMARRIVLRLYPKEERVPLDAGKP